MTRKSPPWTAADKEKLRALAASESPSTIAVGLDPSEPAILIQARKLGIIFKVPNGDRPSAWSRIQSFFKDKAIALPMPN
jgi:hypothetical protein